MKKKPPVVTRKLIAAHKDIYGKEKAAEHYNEIYGRNQNETKRKV